MALLATPLWFCGSVLLAYLCGHGAVTLLFPRHSAHDRFCITPAVGYAVSCWLAFLISGLLRIAVTVAVWYAAVLLAGLTVATIVRNFHNESWSDSARCLLRSITLSVPIVVFVLWPLFVIGADTYLGTVNPDFTFALKDSYFVKDKFSTVAGPLNPPDLYAPFRDASQNLPIHARYIGNIQGILLEQVFCLPARTALTLSLAVWLFCYPQALYFTATNLLGFDSWTSTFTALLAGTSSPIALSYIFFFVGQNSALAVTPLVVTAIFLLLSKPSARSFAAAAVLFCSLFWLYPAHLPYVLIPAALLALYRIWGKQCSLGTVLKLGAAGAGFFALLHAGLGSFWPKYLAAWQHLTGQLAPSIAFLEFLTEQSVPMFLGIVSYTPSISPLGPLLGSWLTLIAFLLAVLAGAGLVAAFLLWARRAPDKGNVAVLGATWLLATLLWWVNTFRFPYGYALLKMGSWVQYAVLPFAAYGLTELWRRTRSGTRSTLWRVLATVASVVWIGNNLLCVLDYAYKTLGRPGPRSGIVNLYNMSGNREYLGLAQAVTRFVPPDSSIGLAFSDSIQGEWVQYYLRDRKLSVLSQYQLPVAEERTRDHTDAGPVVADMYNPYFHGATDGYYLLPTPSSFTYDIIEQPLSDPLWRGTTFDLFRADQADDLMVAGRGFYRLEHALGAANWWPRRFRWTAQSGEFLLLHPDRARGPYRLSMSAIAGYGSISAGRTIEFYRNGIKFGETALSGSGRIVSPAFTPERDVERLIFRIKDRVEPLPPAFRLWNRHISDDQRSLNVAVGDVRILTAQSRLPVMLPGTTLKGSDILRQTYSFDGIEPNAWIREKATLTFVRPPGSNRVEVEMLVPGNTGYRFPYDVTLEVDGQPAAFRASAPGILTARAALNPAAEDGICRIQIVPSQSHLAPGYDQRFRPARFTVRLEAVRFAGGSGPELLSQLPGVAADGWVTGDVVLSSLGGFAGGGIEIEIEIPGWAGMKTQSIVLSSGAAVVSRHTFEPGYHKLVVPPSAFPKGSPLTLRASRSFALPPPDTRKAKLRIKSLSASIPVAR